VTSGPRYLIGIDGGSQSTKVVIYDGDGTVVCEGRQPLRPMRLAAPGVVEHPDDDLWDSLAGACRAALARFPADPAEIAGVGLCTIRFCRALLRADGSLASPVLSWMDARVSRPYRPSDPAVRYVTTSSGYIGHRLTGRRADTAANYQGQWPIDTDTWDWDAQALAGAAPDATRLHREMLFDLVQPGDVLGTVTPAAAAATGIPAGIPVVATANDKAVEALGCGVLTDDVGLISLGTYIAGMVLGGSNPRGTRHYWTNFACLPHTYLHESHGIRRGMWTVSWLRELLGERLTARAAAAGVGVEEWMDAGAAKVPAGSDGLMTVLDWLAPTDAPYKKGVILGFDERHGWEHLYRSVLEGIALTMRNRVRAMCTELDRPLSRLVISGGGSGGDVTMQIFADAFGMPAVRHRVSSAASLGSAICAAAAVGVHPDLAAAARAMARMGDTFGPDPANVALYDRLDEVYQSIPRHTDAVLSRSYPIFR
jgi:sugar (pentulose or hexulose) kinase